MTVCELCRDNSHFSDQDVLLIGFWLGILVLHSYVINVKNETT